MRLQNRLTGKVFFSVALAGAALNLPDTAQAHVSEQSLVLLLPTDYYITSGVFSVLASIILISLTPKSWVLHMFRPVDLPLPAVLPWIKNIVSLSSFACLLAVVVMGAAGPRDPLTNILPMTIWVGFWVVLFGAIGCLGNLWRYINPWQGLYRLLFGDAPASLVVLPERLGVLPGLVLFMAFSAFYIVDPAPNDPDRLAMIVASYWTLTFAAMVIFGGDSWMQRGEPFSILFDLVSRVSPFGGWTRPRIGFPGWNLLSAAPMPISLGLFCIFILGVGSFDGLKDTFWWMGWIGVNPLEFPGRTAVMGSSFLGLLLASFALAIMVAMTFWLGGVMAGLKAPKSERIGFARLFGSFAPTILPIALGYHVSHFFIALLVDGQYLLAAIGDPLATGANFLGLGDVRITTGFLNTTDSVRMIWLSQAGIVVAGHILSVLASHHVALSLFGTPRRAVFSQIPIGIFMIAYTFFGLWLLATPRGA